MTGPNPQLAARWRRLDDAVLEVQQTAHNPDPAKCPDAVARALDALYDLWEYWKDREGLTFADQDQVVLGHPDGETTAALVCARGGKTHDFVEFGDLTDTYSDTYYEHYGCWRWQAYADQEARYAQRSAWYARHIEAKEVLPPLQAATRWLRMQKQLRAH